MKISLTGFDTAIKLFLDQLAKEDETFAKTYAKPNKSIEECCQYIIGEIAKNLNNAHRIGNAQVVGADNDEIYGLAIHYYDEDDIKVEPVKANVAVATSAPTTKTETTPQPAKKTSKPKASKPSVKAAEVDENIPEPLDIPIF